MASNCASNIVSYERSCDKIASGIKNVWLAPYDRRTVWQYSPAGVVTGATSATTFYHAETKPGLCSFVEEGVVNADFGSINITQSFELVLLGQNQTVRTYINSLLGARVVIGVELNESGIFILGGEDQPLEVSATRGTPGIKVGEENSIRVTLSGPQNEYASTISSAYAATILL